MNRIQSLLGLASKAGQIVSGTAGVEAAIKRRHVELVICATDLSEKTLKNFRFWCESGQIKFFCYGTREELGHWIGRPERGIVGIVSREFASALAEALVKELNAC